MAPQSLYSGLQLSTSWQPPVGSALSRPGPRKDPGTRRKVLSGIGGEYHRINGMSWPLSFRSGCSGFRSDYPLVAHRARTFNHRGCHSSSSAPPNYVVCRWGGGVVKHEIAKHCQKLTLLRGPNSDSNDSVSTRPLQLR
jgi:hypothetical protein